MNLARTFLLLLAFGEVWLSGALAVTGNWNLSLLMLSNAVTALFVCAYLPETLRALGSLFTKEDG